MLGRAPVLLLVIALSTAEAAGAADAPKRETLATTLLRGCLAGPTRQSTSSLAAAVGATAFSRARLEDRLKVRHETTVVDDNTRPDQAQRTVTAVTGFLGWDLPGPGAGQISYVEEDYRMARIRVATGELLTPWRASRNRACHLNAPVLSAREIFEIYERLQPSWFGILISNDRRWVSFFTFQQDRMDIELQFTFEKPIGGLPAGAEASGMSRIALIDGGARFANNGGPGVATLSLTRAELLAALDQPADMQFMNEAMEPIVQRLTAVNRPAA